MNFNWRIYSGRCIANYWFPFRTCKRFFSESYYDVLKVSPSCTPKEIREAFLVLSKKTHPDKHLNDPSMHEKFVRLNEAYSTLINPSSRRAYDLTLYNERKLNPPYDRPYSGTYAKHRTSNYGSYESSRSSQHSYSSYYKDPFSWDEKTKTESKFGQHFSTGLRGVKKFSNTVVVAVLLTITVVGAVVQLLTIRHSFLISQEQMLEKSRQYSLIHKLARENARLYGNAHQIEVLKKNLAGSYKLEATDNSNVNKKLATDPRVEKDLLNNNQQGKDEMIKKEEYPGEHLTGEKDES